MQVPFPSHIQMSPLEHFVLVFKHRKVMLHVTDLQRRFLAQHGVAILLRHCFEWLQHCSSRCNGVLRQKSSLRIVPCDITFTLDLDKWETVA